MKYCENCGKPIGDNASFCSECGAKVNKNSESEPIVYRVPGTPIEEVSAPIVKKTNVVAIISLVLSIIGFFIIPLLFSTGGLITGIVGYNTAVNTPNMKGKKMSIWSIIIGAIGLAYGIIQFLITLG